METNELMHYGVKGMKWGVRRFQNKDGTLTAAGKARKNKPRYGSEKEEQSSDRDHSKSDKTPLALLALRIPLDVITLNSIGLSQDVARISQAGKSFINDKVFKKDREGCEVDKKTGLLLKKTEMTQKQDAARVNPLVHNFDNNTKNNCMLCTSTYELRRRGFEVRAKKASYGYVDDEVNTWFPKAKLQTVEGYNKKGKPNTFAMIDNLEKELVKQGEGARGNLMVNWALTKGGHSMAYEVSGGKVQIIDAQIGKIYKKPSSILSECMPQVVYARLDNVDFNPKTIKEVAE